jgi:hypothetical protein
MDPSVHYRNVAAGYTEGIRNTDAKAFIGVLFTATMMATVVGWRATFPHYLTPLFYVAPFLAIFFLLLFCVFPRFPKSGAQRFPLLRRADPEVFLLVLDKEGERAALPMFCAMLARILYWKTLTLRIAYSIMLFLIVAGQILLVFDYFWPVRG